MVYLNSAACTGRAKQSERGQKMRRFVIVNDPRFAIADTDYYIRQASSIVTKLREDGRLGKDNEVLLITNVDEAVRACGIENATIVFLSLSAASWARKIAQKYGKRIRVFCYTGGIPRDEVIWHDKGEGDGTDSLVDRLFQIR